MMATSPTRLTFQQRQELKRAKSLAKLAKRTGSPADKAAAKAAEIKPVSKPAPAKDVVSNATAPVKDFTAPAAMVLTSDILPLGEGVDTNMLAKLCRMLYESAFSERVDEYMRRGALSGVCEALGVKWNREDRFRKANYEVICDTKDPVLLEYLEVVGEMVDDAVALQGNLIEEFIDDVVLRFAAGFTRTLTKKHLTSLFLPLQVVLPKMLYGRRYSAQLSMKESSHKFVEAFFLWCDSNHDEVITASEIVQLIVNLVQTQANFAVTVIKTGVHVIDPRVLKLGMYAANANFLKKPLETPFDYKEFKKIMESRMEMSRKEKSRGDMSTETKAFDEIYEMIKGVKLHVIEGMLKGFKEGKAAAASVPGLMTALTSAWAGLKKSATDGMKAHADAKGNLTEPQFMHVVLGCLTAFGNQLATLYPTLLSLAPMEVQGPAMMAAGFIHIPAIVKQAFGPQLNGELRVFRDTASAFFELFATNGLLTIDKFKMIQEFIFTDMSNLDKTNHDDDRWIIGMIPKLLALIDADHDNKISPLETGQLLFKFVDLVASFVGDVIQLVAHELFPSILEGALNMAIAMKPMVNSLPLSKEVKEAIMVLDFPLRKAVAEKAVKKMISSMHEPMGKSYHISAKYQ